MTTSDLTSVPMGIDERGEIWRTPLDQASTVIGGVPGAGKSVAMNVLLANVAHRPDVQIVAMDMKEGLEMKPWLDRCSATAFTQTDAVKVFQQLMELHKRRAEVLHRSGKASFANLGYSETNPLHLVVIDEAAELFTPESSSKEDKAVAADCLTYVSKIVRLCRATGIFVVLATQKPTVDSLPSIIRDNCASKIAFRCMTNEQAIAIHGDALKVAEFSPTSIKKDQKGVAVAANADGDLYRVRGFYLGEEDRREIVRRTAHLARNLDGTPKVVYWDKDDPDDGPDLDLSPRRPSGPSLPPGVTGCHFGPIGEAS
jgi:hypothetical protein